MTGGKRPEIEKRRTPGLPGAFGDFMWVDSPDFGDRPEDRRIPRVYDVDPAPLARVISVYLGIIEGNLQDCMREVADDERDGPIHVVHLLAACEYAARQTGGGMPGPGAPAGHPGAGLISAMVSGHGILELTSALRRGGLAAATATARAMDRELRYRVLDSLLSYWWAPIGGLCIDITDEMIGVRRHDH